MKAMVIGCGVSGLSSALCLQEAGGAVQVLTRELPEETTSTVAGAIWHPLSAVGDARLTRWCHESRRRFDALTADPASGVTRLPLHEPVPWDATNAAWEAALRAWRRLIPDVEALPAAQLPPGYTRGIRYTTYLVETPLYMAYLLDRFRARGGTVTVRAVDDLDEVARPDQVVVNCTGAWAGDLTGDARVYPIRGQVIRLAPQPQQTHGFHVSGGPLDFTYIFPRSQDCILGGTYEPGVWERTPDPALLAGIRRRCFSVEPSLADADVLDVRVGLRPGRDEVRLEGETRDGATVIHNYGHGGIGFTLSWGCAADVVKLAQVESDFPI